MRKRTPNTEKVKGTLKRWTEGLVCTHRILRQCQQMPLDRDAKLSPSPHKSAMKNYHVSIYENLNLNPTYLFIKNYDTEKD